MKKCVILFLTILIYNCFMFGQEKKDSLDINYIYAPQLYDNLSAEESWEIYKTAYIKKLKIKGLTDDEIKKSLINYEKQKEEYIAEVKEKLRLATIEREKAEAQRKLAAIERKKANKLRKLADIQRKKADELRKLADMERKKADEKRAKDTIQREKADRLRKQADIERAKAEERRKLAEIQRAKAEEQRKKAQEWRKNAENILIKNITLSNQSISQPIFFQVTSKTTLRIGIRAHISSGATLIEIYNPKGIKQGEMSLNFKPKSSSNNKSEDLEYTSGALDKTILDAEAGEWYIKILPNKKSEGYVAMSVAQEIKSPLDE